LDVLQRNAGATKHETKKLQHAEVITKTNPIGSGTKILTCDRKICKTRPDGQIMDYDEFIHSSV
jgi:hypothetical protein